MMDFIIVAYHTKGKFYNRYASELISSLHRFQLPLDVQEVPDLGSWLNNVNYKPIFLKSMLDKHKSSLIVYVDCDAEFRGYPELFNTFDSDIGLYLFNRKKNYKIVFGFELLSGTILLKNNKYVNDVLDQWLVECTDHPKEWDQHSLERVLVGNLIRHTWNQDSPEQPVIDSLAVKGVSIIPPEYCTIDRTMSWVSNPIIYHKQATRYLTRVENGGLK